MNSFLIGNFVDKPDLKENKFSKENDIFSDYSNFSNL